MKRKESMGYLDTTWHHVRRSPYQAIAAIFILMQTFFVASVFTFIIVGSALIIKHLESLPQVHAFFKNEVKQEEIDRFKIELERNEKISKVEFVSHEQAFNIYREQNKEDPLLLEFVSPEILPRSFKISATSISSLPDVAEMLGRSALVDRIVFQKDVVANFTAFTQFVRKIGIVLISILALDSIFIMVIIIGIKISQKREEIKIMQLIGATSWYIRWPFIFEGMLYGVVGAILGWLSASLGLLYATPFLSAFLQDIPLLPVSPIFLFEVLGAQLLIAIILGAFSSYLAVLRYLR